MSTTLEVKKLALVLATSVSIIVTSIETVPTIIPTFEVPDLNSFPLLLKRMPYIYHLVQFKNDQAKVHTLWNSGNKVNIMIPAYVASLGLKIRPPNVRAQKINNLTFETLKMVLASF